MRLGLDQFVANPLSDIIWRGSGSYYLVDLGSEGWEPHNFVVQLLVKEGWWASLAGRHCSHSLLGSH